MKAIKIAALCLALTLSNLVSASQISGTLESYPEQKIELVGFNGINKQQLGTTQTDKKGFFTLTYDGYTGGGHLLIPAKDKGVLLLLTDPEIKINLKKNKPFNALTFSKGNDNQQWVNYIHKQGQRSKAMPAWEHLLSLYQEKAQADTVAVIEKEISRLKEEEVEHLNKLKDTAYASWFISIKTLISAMQQDVINAPENIPTHIQHFNDTDLTSDQIWYSSLLQPLLQGHYLMLENSGKSLPEVFSLMDTSTSVILEKLKKDPEKLNMVSEFLFDFLRKRSLHKPAEYLAVHLLQEHKADLNTEFAKRLEVFGALKQGAKAPLLQFEANKTIKDKKLLTKPYSVEKESRKAYHLVMLFQEGCKRCATDLKRLQKLFPKLTSMDVTAIYESDKDWQSHNQYPWVSAWNSAIFDDFYVWEDSSYFILDKNLNIISMNLPLSWGQVEAFAKKTQLPK